MICEWEGCHEFASRHVRFGLRTFGVVKVPEDADIPHTTQTLFLCEHHIDLILNNYLDVTVTEISPTITPT